MALEMDPGTRIFTTLPLFPVDRRGGGREATLNFAHFVNGTWITDLVFVNLSTEASRPAPTPFHTDILPSRPAIYFYDTEGHPIAAESVVDITGDLEITKDGGLTVQPGIPAAICISCDIFPYRPIAPGPTEVHSREQSQGLGSREAYARI